VNDKALQLSFERRAYRQVTFSHKASSNVWQADFSGVLELGTFSPGDAIRLTLVHMKEKADLDSAWGRLSLQSSEHESRGVDSGIPFQLPTSVGLFTLPNDPSVEARSLPPEEGSWEVPADQGGKFDARLLFSVDGTQQQEGPTFPRGPRFSRQKDRENESFTVPVTLRLEPGRRKKAERLHELAQSLQENDDLPRAINAARQAVELLPEDAAFQNTLAWYLVLEKNYSVALPVAREAVRLQPKNELIQDTLAHAAYGARQWREAAEAWNQAFTLDPDFLVNHPDPMCTEDKQHWDDAKKRAGIR
jgi:hypothetical protein